MGYAIYLLIGTFVAGAISVDQHPKDGLTIPFTAVMWPVYVLIRLVKELVE